MNIEEPLVKHPPLPRHTHQFAALVAVLLTMLLTATPAHAAAVGITVPNVKASSGSQVKVPITVAGAPAMGALQLVMTYDATVLEPQSATKGKLVSDNSSVETSTQPGRFAITLLTTDSINGDGEVLVAQFKVLGKKGAKSTLGLDRVAAWQGDVNRFDIKMAPTSGEFEVGGGGGFPWWIIAVIVAAVVVAYFVMRRRQTPAPVPAMAGGPPVSGAPPVVATEQWVYVDQPQQLQDSTGKVVATLHPGTWYRANRYQGEWVEVTDDHGATGWVRESATRRRD
jgi:hypothetical protein